MNPIKRFFGLLRGLLFVGATPAPVALTAATVIAPEATQPTETPAPAVTVPAATTPAKPRKSTAGLRERIADTLDDIMSRLQALELRGVKDRLASHDAALAMQQLMGCDFHFIDGIGVLAGIEEAGTGYFNESAGELIKLEWPLDVGVIVPKDNRYFLLRMIAVTPKELRGKIRLVPTNVAKIVTADLYDDGSWHAEERLVGLINGQWTPLDTGMRSSRAAGNNAYYTERRYSADDISELRVTTALAMSIAFTNRYSWQVALGASVDGPRVLIPTSPRGCVEIFKDRDVDPNRSRRAALRHWVANHFRESSAEGISYVRDHLRGRTEFRWRDLECEIFVSKFDLEKNEFFKSQASEWRAARKHNRVKVRIKKRIER